VLYSVQETHQVAADSANATFTRNTLNNGNLQQMNDLPSQATKLADLPKTAEEQK